MKPPKYDYSPWPGKYGDDVHWCDFCYKGRDDTNEWNLAQEWFLAAVPDSDKYIAVGLCEKCAKRTHDHLFLVNNY